MYKIKSNTRQAYKLSRCSSIGPRQVFYLSLYTFLTFTGLLCVESCSWH